MSSEFIYPPTIDPDGLAPSGLIPIPHGSAEFDAVYNSFRGKIEIEKNRNSPFVTFWNQTYLCDMRAGVLAAKDLNIPSFVVMNVDDEGTLSCGADFSACLVTLQSIGAAAVGLSAPTVEAAADILKTASQYAEIPLIAVLPKDAEYHDAVKLKKSGADIFAYENSELREKIDKEMPVRKKESNENLDDFGIATIETELFHLGSNITFSEHLNVDFELSDELLTVESAGINAALVVLNNLDDAKILAAYVPMTRLPIAVHAHEMKPLLYALKNINGRIIIDTSSGLELNDLKTAAERYGAILY